MQKSLKKLSKIFFLSVLLIFTACNKDETIIEDNVVEHFHENRQGFIDFETLFNDIGTSEAFRANIEYLDKNKDITQGRGAKLVDAYIDTSTIHLIETDSMNYYTLKIINNNPDEKPNIFYNLVFEQNFVTGTVESSILQYNPELSWLLDKTKDFEGSIKKFDNAEITLDDLINGTHLENRSVS